MGTGNCSAKLSWDSTPVNSCTHDPCNEEQVSITDVELISSDAAERFGAKPACLLFGDMDAFRNIAAN